MDLGFGIWDPGSGKNYYGSRIPEPGVKKGTGSRIRNTVFVTSKLFNFED